jgi:hypothetical protein
MISRLLPMAAACALLVTMTGTDVRAAVAKVPEFKPESTTVAQVRHRHGGYYKWSGPRRHVWYSHGPRRHVWRHRHGPRFAIFAGPLWWGYYPYYRRYDDCAWLRRKAIVTGSPYWWRRYRWCRSW